MSTHGSLCRSLKKYGPIKALELSQQKTRQGLVKSNPDFPGDVSQQLFWSFDKSKQQRKQIEGQSLSGSAKVGVDGDLGAVLFDAFKEPPAEKPPLLKQPTPSAPPTPGVPSTGAAEPGGVPSTGAAEPVGEPLKKAMKGSRQGSKPKKEEEPSTPHARAQKWADRLLADISEAKTLVLKLSATPHCESVKQSIVANSKKLEEKYGELAALLRVPTTPEKKFVESVRAAHTILVPHLEDVEHAKKVLSHKVSKTTAKKSAMPSID